MKKKIPEWQQARAIDFEGNVLPMGARTVRETIDAALAEPDTELILVIARMANGDLVAPAFGPPSRVTLAILQQAVVAYEQALSAIEKGDVS